MKTAWKEWNPGIANNGQTLGEVLQTLPGNPPEDISKIVRLLENPQSPFALSGAITLERHDCMHILLGRGLLNQDEAFVIGYTMGTASKLKSYEAFLFKTISARLYPRQYRFSSKHLKVYDMAMALAKTNPVKDLHLFAFEEHHTTTLGELRGMLGIDLSELRALFKKEQSLIPHSKASKRLLI